MFENYKPQPLDTSGVDVSSILFRSLIERVARQAHNDWMVSRRAEFKGLSDAQIREQYPMFKPWEDLSDAEKASPRDSACEAVKLLEKRFGVGNIMHGYVSKLDIVDAIAENAHEVWAKQRMDAGWTWGEKRDNAARKHPMLKPYGDLPDSEKEYDRAYGRIAYEAIQGMRLESEDRVHFRQDVIRGVWGLEPNSPEAKALERFSGVMAGMWEGDQLDLVNRALRKVGDGDAAPALQEFKGELLSTLGSEVASVRENLGKPGYASTMEEYMKLSREVAEQMKTGFGRDEMDLLGRDGIMALRDAYVGKLMRQGAAQEVIASFSPDEGRRMKSREMMARFRKVGLTKKNDRGIR